MALRVDRPSGGSGDDVVVSVARSPADARKVRDALVAGGVGLELPDAAIDGLFATGAASLPIKVPSRDVVKGLEVVDALFPREELVLPPLPAAPAPAAPPDDDADDEDEGGENVRAAAEKGRARKLATTAGKTAAIAGGSLLVPGQGLLFALCALAGAAWCLARAREVADPEVAASVRRRARVALLLGAASVLASAVAIRVFLGRD
jgi:hypothetical protein